MKNVIRILTLVLCSLSVVFCFACNSDPQLPVTQLPSIVEGETFEITLPAKASTGHRWIYKITPSVGIEFITVDYFYPNNDPNILGGGTLVYKFRAINAGEYTIRYDLVRSFGEDRTPVMIGVYEIEVLEQ